MLVFVQMVHHVDVLIQWQAAPQLVYPMALQVVVVVTATTEQYWLSLQRVLHLIFR